MPGIVAKRFEVLSRETNLCTAKYLEGDNGISNVAENLFKEPMDSLTQVIKSATQAVNTQSLIDQGKGLLDDITRETKGIQATIADLTKLSANDLDQYLGMITGGDLGSARNLKDTLKNCSSKGAGFQLPNGPGDINTACNGGKGSIGSQQKAGSGCNASGVNDLIKKLTGVELGKGSKTLQDKINQLMALSGLGYNLGVCGALGALAKDISPDQIGKAVGSLLETFGSAGNTNAVFDMAKIATNTNVSMFNPTAVGTFFDNFDLPLGVKGTEYAQLGERVLGSAELINTNWMKSTVDNGLTIAQSTVKTSGLDQVLGSTLTNKSYGENALNIAPSSDNDFLISAYKLF